MRRLRTSTIAVPVVLLAVLAPASAAAGPLLSGYGGPGQGNQAILGSALLNGPDEGSGGGSGSSGASPSSSGAAPEPAGQEASAAREGGKSGGSPRAHHVGRRDARGSRPPAGARGVARPFKPIADVGSQPLGLSGADLLYLLLGLAALVMTAAITRILVRRTP
jgi:hypothetical protein